MKDVYKRLKMVEGNGEQIQRKIDVIMSLYKEKFFQAVADIDDGLIAKKLNQSNQVAALSSTFLQHQQVS